MSKIKVLIIILVYVICSIIISSSSSRPRQVMKGSAEKRAPSRRRWRAQAVATESDKQIWCDLMVDGGASLKQDGSQHQAHDVRW